MQPRCRARAAAPSVHAPVFTRRAALCELLLRSRRTRDAVARDGTKPRQCGREMALPPFKLERWFAQYEFSAPYQLCNSDCEALTMSELLNMSDPETLGTVHL